LSDPPPLAKPVAAIPAGTIAGLRRAAAGCTACDLYRIGTQTVFGDGNSRARVVLIGEQPGSHEDLQGLPFVGPAGKLLDELLSAAGLDRDTLYLTNTVKHFKYEPRGKVRLHKRANAAEQAACRPWLAAELSRIRPDFVVALGAMAAQTVFGNAFRVTRDRGRWFPMPAGYRALASWHPSAILRMQDPERSAARAQLLRDLREVRRALEQKAPSAHAKPPPKGRTRRGG
jgi:uracil-DNA glycosylase